MNDVFTELGIEPLIPLAQAVDLIPMVSENTLRRFLSIHREIFPARYQRSRRARGIRPPLRMLTRTEILRIREMITFSAAERVGKPRGRAALAYGSGNSLRNPSRFVIPKNEPIVLKQLFDATDATDAAAVNE